MRRGQGDRKAIRKKDVRGAEDILLKVAFRWEPFNVHILAFYSFKAARIYPLNYIGGH